MHIGLFLILIMAMPVAANELMLQRWQFQQAYKAIHSGQQPPAINPDYPLAHYVTFFQLQRGMDNASAETIQEFLTTYADSPVANILRSNWLQQLAKRKDWQQYDKFYQPQQNISLQCHALNAKLELKQSDSEWQMQAIKLWLVGKSQPTECDPVFNHLYKNNVIGNDLRWQRAQLSLHNGQFSLASFLARPLSQEQRDWVTRWQAMHNEPDQQLNNFNYNDSEIARNLLQYGVEKLARNNAAQAHKHWNKYKTKYNFTSKAMAELDTHIAIWAASQKLPQALDWLMEKNLIHDQKLHQSMLNIALEQEDWAAIIKFINDFNPDVITEPQWQYWLARAYEQTSQFTAAKRILTELAQIRSYYGFLAAERVKQKFSFAQQEPSRDEEQINSLLNEPGVIRAKELYELDLINYARLEWQQVVDQATDKQLINLALLAHDLGWHDRAIRLAVKANILDSINLRFPRPYYDLVLQQAENNNISYAWIYAIMRQESAFQVDAKSSANALGLMQLLPATARQMASKAKINIKHDADILSPENNITLGVTYLRHLLDRFNNNYLLATVGYNAGPGRAARWIQERPCIPVDIWVELIPFSETRNYVKSVMSFTLVFDYLISGHVDVEPMPLSNANEQSCHN